MASDPIHVQEEVPLAIDGKGIYFYFDRKKKTAVLDDVNISVTRGAIYSLLGPSGCGKTTLLKCITGQHKLQVGSLRLFGKIPGSKGFFIPGRGLGYMPQDMALYPEMSAQETLMYFGSLFLMNRQEIKERISFLIELLALPDQRKLIKHLSGGQQRRVSLAAALVHKPPLLILDEPTVGVDPLLRQNIWDHLTVLAKDEGMTIIITTHYIEEARQADIVGLMRDGHLLAERNPEDLIKQYQVSTLEKVFLRLCQNSCNEKMDCKNYLGTAAMAKSFPRKSSTMWISKEENEPSSEKELLGKSEQAIMLRPMKESCSVEVDKCRTKQTFNEGHEAQDNTAALLSPDLIKDVDVGTSKQVLGASWKRMLCLTKKNFLRFKRNNLFMIVQVLLPCIEMIFFCVCVGGDPFNLPVAVTNVEENPGGLSKDFLQKLSNKTILQKEYSNFSEAIESVRNGESWAAMHIGPEFSNCLIERYTAGTEVDNDTVHCSEISLHLDMSNQLIAATVFSHFLTAFKTFVSDLLLNYGKNPEIGNSPITIKDTIYGSSDTSFTEFVTPGMVLGITYATSTGLTALTIILEKKQGLLDRTLAADASPVEVLMSIFIVMLLFVITQTFFVLLSTFLLFDIACNGPFTWVAIAVILAGAGGIAYGMLMSAMLDDENAALFLCIGSVLPNLLLSGIMWPIEAMPYYLRYISYCLPLTLISRSVRCIVSRGWNITDHYIWDGYLICIAWTILFMSLTVLLFKIRK